MKKSPLPLLTIIPAGAGSGKTYTVQQRLGEWVEKQYVDPERIVAVTFTEAAAAELRERIRAKLLESNRLNDALKLDQAYISTIHGFGLNILTEFAFEAGCSPKPRLLNEDEQTSLIKQALSLVSKTQAITRDLSSFGYTFDFNLGKGAEDLFRDDVLSVITLLRSVGWQNKDESYTNKSINWVKKHYGSSLKAETLTSELHRCVEELIKNYPHSLADEFGTSATSIKDFKTNFRDLRSALVKENISQDWSLWQRLRNLRLSKRGCPVPEEYEFLAQRVMDAANQLPYHPGPLLHACNHIEILIEVAQDVLVFYSEAKRDAGLVDYTDMIAMAHSLLANNQKVLQTMVERIDCLVIDEFQDTNPLQFSLLWILKEAGIPTLVVGDLKQAIMGFQGADPRLSAAIESNYADS
ncbi:MAG: UvrD-helicase domain-containing protein, partial [Kangiellaceae bacterium]|nr:UvrD-helicase domain-containing protein [Kangiellaceae bacterium]